MNHLPRLFVLATGLWLVFFPAMIVFARRRTEAFLQSFASSARAHYLEQGIRLIVGTAFVLFASEMRFAREFQYFGWILVVTTIGLLLVPWRWHSRFAGKVVPWAIRHIKLYALGSFLFGAFILFAVLSPTPVPKTAQVPLAEIPLTHDYVFVFLTTGERAGELDEAAVAAAGAGHRARIESLGAAGTLLLAGPFGEPRADENWRGIYVFDVPDLHQAEELARTDPAVVAGLFDLKLVPWRSSVDLRPFRARVEQGKAAGEPFVPAAYVLAIGEPTEGARRLLPGLFAKGKVISVGELSGELAGEREGRLLLLLKAETVEEARAWLESDDSPVRWELSSFWATALLGELATVR